MASQMFEFAGALDASEMTAIATGYVADVMAWEDTANGRRPSSLPETDPVTGETFRIADTLMPLGRDGQPVLVGVRFASKELPELTPYAPVELVGLRVKVRASRQGKGVDVSFTADAVRPVGPQRQARRSTEGEAA
jgi:hypothetical protein